MMIENNTNTQNTVSEQHLKKMKNLKIALAVAGVIIILFIISLINGAQIISQYQ